MNLGMEDIVNKTMRGIEIFHPTENKFVPVILSANGMFVSETAALDVVFNNNESLLVRDR